jgi:hypothetical protein
MGDEAVNDCGWAANLLVGFCGVLCGLDNLLEYAISHSLARKSSNVEGARHIEVIAHAMRRHQVGRGRGIANKADLSHMAIHLGHETRNRPFLVIRRALGLARVRLKLRTKRLEEGTEVGFLGLQGSARRLGEV